MEDPPKSPLKSRADSFSLEKIGELGELGELGERRE